jgi:hypothetical protein
MLFCLPLFAFVSSAQLHTSGYDTPTMIDFESTDVTVSESATNVILHLFRTGEFRVTSRIDYRTVEDTASEGEDYQGGGGTLIFQPGEGYKTISIPIIADELLEGPETFRVELSTADDHIILVRNSATVTIQESTNQVAAIPRLEIERAQDGSILLSWLKTNSNFILETASACSASAWQKVSAQPQLKGSKYEVMQPLQSSLQVFRLKAQ